MIEFDLWLYGKPAWDMEYEGTALPSDVLRDNADMIRDHCHAVANIIDKFNENGVEMQMGLYNIFGSKNGINTKEDAIEFLNKIGIDSELVSVNEIDEEIGEEDEEDDDN